MANERQIISHLPLVGLTPEQWRATIESELVEMWTDLLTDKEREWANASGQNAVVPPKVSQSALAKFDALVLRQAETLGWRIGSCELVQRRFSQWETDPKGPEKFRKFGRAMERSAKTIQGKIKPPVDPGEKIAKRETVAELRLILQRMKAEAKASRAEKSRAENAATFLGIVRESKEFVQVRANIARWQAFLIACPDDTFRPSAETRPTRPAELYDEWWGWCRGYTPGSAKTIIAHLKP